MNDSVEVQSSTSNEKPLVGWPQAFRDIGISAIGAGQFPFFCLFVVVLAIVVKMPSEDVSEMVFQILKNIKDFAISGYILFVTTLVLGFFYLKSVRKSHSQQLLKRDVLIDRLKEDLKGRLEIPVIGETT